MKPKTWSHPKFALLKRRLRIGNCVAAGLLENLWYLATTFDPDAGRLDHTPEEIDAWLELDLPDVTPQLLIDTLVEIEWLERDDAGNLSVHDWQDHKPGYVKEAERKRKARAGLSMTVPDIPGQSAPVLENPSAAAPSHSPLHGSMDRVRGGNMEKTPSAPKSVVASVTIDEIASLADDLFRACHYKGDKGGNLWKVAGLLHTGIGDLTEAEVYSAARAAETCKATDKAAYFYRCLSSALSERGMKLQTLLGRIRITPNWPATRPYAETAAT